VASVAVHPRSPHILYAGTIGCVFKSNDGGLSWVDIHHGGGLTWTAATDIPNGFPILSRFAWDPANPERVFAGGPQSWLGVSEDVGQNWTRLLTPSFSEGASEQGGDLLERRGCSGGWIRVR
jgi:photosystem II stability/assembly factor-like uncharacterized protein